VSLACGVDFGTSNSSIGVALADKPRLVRLDGDRFTLPSAIFYPSDGSAPICGSDAINHYIEHESGRLFRSLKSVLGSSLINESTAAGRKRISFKSIIGKFLRHLKERTEAEVGTEVTAAVLGRPVFFVDDDAAADANAQEQLREIAASVGFEDILFQYEPIAAALDYERSITREEIVLVADIGGGTSDFALIRVSPERRLMSDRKQDILANAGVHVGGTDLDYRLSLKQIMPQLGYQTRQRLRPELDLPTHYYFEMTQWHRIIFLYTQKAASELRYLRSIAAEPEKVDRFIKAVHDKAGHRIAGDVESAKIALSRGDETTIDLSYIEEELAIPVTRDIFEASIDHECSKISKSVRECLKQANVRPEQVDTLFLTGGSTSIPLIEAACRDATPDVRTVRGDKFASVGIGLTIDAGLKFGAAERRISASLVSCHE
jgi:hypothetical chaperone protein